MLKTPITALIIDDEPLAREYIRALLKTDDEIKITGECGNGRDAAKLISANKPQLIFLDVQMPEVDGFSLLQKLDKDTLPAIIFTTAFEDYAIRAFEFHALDYLLKPFDAERFQKAVSFAKQRLLDRDQQAQETVQITELLKNIEEKPKYLDRFLIKQNGRIIFLKISEIDFLRADDKYIQLHSGKSIHLVRQTLGAMRNQLNPQTFVQIHRSVIVNTERIKELEAMFNGDHTVVMENGAKLPLSRNYKTQLFERLGNLL